MPGKFPLRGVIFLLFLIFSNYQEVLGSEAEQNRKTNIRMSTLTGLHLGRISLLVLTSLEHGQYKEKFIQQTFNHFKNNGLAINAAGKSAATLVLTLKAKKIEGTSDREMYTSKLELLETVQLNRQKEILISAVTWSYGFSQPIIVNKITEEKMQSDLDHLVLQFIESYKMANQQE